MRQNRITVERVKNKDLKYYEVKFTCIHGGRNNFKSRGKQLRKTSTFQCGCPFFINLRLSDDGHHLIVTNVNASHANHDADEEEYNFLPKARKLDDTEIGYAEEMLSMGANKKKIQQQIFVETGKRVIMKDLSNIHTSSKRKHHGTKNDLSKCVDLLRNNHSCTVDISTDAEEIFCGLFIQDEQMRQLFAAYPEIIFLDATYKLLELQFPVYLFVVEDSNGATVIVGMGFLVTENAESMRWLVETFMNKNPATRNTRIIMADKDLNERDIIKELLPWAKVLICLFHTLKTFRREITMEKMQVTSEMQVTSVMRENCLKFIEKMSYAKCAAEYDGIYAQFINMAPASVKNYFNTNWHPI